jgi:hypothetical protein
MLKRMACIAVSGAPPQRAGKNLEKYDDDRKADPAQTRDVEARCQIGQIDLAQREIKQRRRDQYFYGCKQDPAHVAEGHSQGIRRPRRTLSCLGMVLAAIWQ